MSEKTLFSFKSMSYFLPKSIRQHWIDIVILLVLAIVFAITSFFSAQQVPDAILNDFYTQDVWFGSDIPTVFGNITSFKSDYGRNNKHPLFPLIALPAIVVLEKVLNLEPVLAARIVVALVAALWMGSLYVLFRLISDRRFDAVAFSLLGGVSAASVFWFVVPESFSYGSLTILLALVFVALTQHRRFSPIWYVAISGLTLSITLTNWMAGLLATIVNHRWKKALQITVLAFLSVIAFWVLQRAALPNTGFPFQPGTFVGETKFMTEPESNSILEAVSSFVYQTIVMPSIQLTDSALRPGWPKLEIDTLSPGSGGVWGTIAVLSWTTLLGLGVWGFFGTKQYPKLRIVLGLTIVGQLLIHSVYGTQETFIYSLHFAPLLLAVAAFSTLTRLRLLALVLASILAISAGLNNRSQFNQLTGALVNYGTPQQQVQARMRLRPADPWPRSTGHVILAAPGSLEADKAYHEPGGSFSPAAGSFGLSIWLVDSKGNLQITSDSIPLNEIQQQFVYNPTRTIPDVLTETEHYQALWSATKPGLWQLNLQVPAASENRAIAVVRSVGPAGGAITSLNWDGQRLLINDRWSVKNVPNLAKVYLGSENDAPDWIRQKSNLTQWQDPNGWGYARFEIAAGNAWDLVIEDATPEPKPTLNAATASNLAFDLPDPQFLNSLNAQIAHLNMGLVGNRTRPSDPIDHPLPRFRDGAYQMVALAHAGQLEVAKQLSTYFAENDFINSISPEADIPAVGIWALAEVAAQLNDPEYDRSIWTHVQRKAELIVEMLSSNRPGYPIIAESNRPFSEYPDFVETALAAGKMTGSPGLISIDLPASIMSYRGLMDAAVMAIRVNQPAAAERWRSHATKIQAAWQQEFEPAFSNMNITYTSGLWPSWIAASTQEPLAEKLQQRWDVDRDAKGAYRQAPLTTYFGLAEAHQWLFLKKPDRVWATLQWFWEHQASPGLYTWSVENNEPSAPLVPKSFSHWQRFRGWVNPPNITPQYWTAAEMTLLQLDMLAYADQTTASPTLVVGAGIPKQWLNQPMSVKGLPVHGNLVDWAWDGQKMNVQIRGKRTDVQLGSAFPPNTSVTVTTQAL